MPSLTLTLPDGTPITRYAMADEGLHEPGPEENWQESCALIDARDLAQGISIFMRFGHEPVMDGGNMTLWAFLKTPELDFKHTEQFPKREGDVAGNCMSAGGVASYDYDGEHIRFAYDNGEVSWALKLTPLHQPIPLSLDDGADYRKNIGSSHHENMDLCEGTITIRGEQRPFRALSYRDHSWGPRNWKAMRVHRWTCGQIGEDFSFAFGNILSESPAISRRGYIREGAIVHYTNDVEILPLMEADGLTYRSAVINVGLNDGRRFKIDLVPYGKGALNQKRSNFLCDNFCEVRLDGRTGTGFLEVSENHRVGERTPDVVINAYLANGLFPKE